MFSKVKKTLFNEIYTEKHLLNILFTNFKKNHLFTSKIIIDNNFKLYYYFFACDAPLVKWYNRSMVRIHC